MWLEIRFFFMQLGMLRLFPTDVHDIAGFKKIAEVMQAGLEPPSSSLRFSFVR